jgi:hypothetical protein
VRSEISWFFFIIFDKGRYISTEKKYILHYLWNVVLYMVNMLNCFMF